MRYVAIHSEGNLIPYDLLDKIAADQDVAGQKPADFGLPKGRRLTDEISRVWADAQNLWNNFKRRRQSLTDRDPYGTSITRTWIMGLLSDPQMLGFELKLQTSAAVVNNVKFDVSHREGDGERAIAVHIEGCKIDLDRRLHTRLRTSPQAMLQDFLNNSETLWGMVTNGVTLRLLRESARTSRPTYLEFDLESIFEGNRFNEFALLYRVCHRTRFPKPEQRPSDCLLEKYYQDSIEQGQRIREDLSKSVKQALEILGTEFLRHPDNHALRERTSVPSAIGAPGSAPLADGVRVANGSPQPPAASGPKLSPDKYHRQLLLLVYRLLFLMVAEERHLIVAAGEHADRNQKIYDQWYSVTHLRDRAARIVEESAFCDLWEGLKQTFALFEYGLDSNALGIPPLNGDLFHEKRAIPDLAQTQLYNHDLLRAVRHLSLFRSKNRLERVNYSALNVEELGSVYESLLDFKPVIERTEQGMSFVLREGTERKSTGSYYTRPELVHELIQSALVPVMQDRIAEAEKAAAGKDLIEERNAKANAILNIKVCDPACGSGHFLLAAARTLGKELARIRTGEDEPTPQKFREAVREVIQHCIYGVDLNPLAVDLCKLALWLESHAEGKPLSFLDHRIRLGNSLVGILDPEVMADGIPDEAFTAVTGDDKLVAAALKRRNRQERTSRQRGFSFEGDDHSAEYAAQRKELEDLKEDTAAAVRRKAEVYSGWRAGMQHAHDEAVSDLWTAQFFNSLTRATEREVCTTKDFLEFAIDKQKKPLQVAVAQALSLKQKFFHWHLEFPEVFEKGGFDVALGNPPWERITLKEEEHWVGDPYILGARNKAERAKRIREYRMASDSEMNEKVRRFDLAKRAAENESKYIRSAMRYPLTGVGDVNTYAVFAELARAAVAANGRVGLLLPTGLVTDDRTKAFFNEVMRTRTLVSFLGMDNEKQIFPSIDHRNKFGLLCLSGSPNPVPPLFTFSCSRIEWVRDPQRRFSMSERELRLLNPETQTCPVFRSMADAELAKRLYGSFPVIGSAWGVRFLRMFDMAGDSELFEREEKPRYVRLYEGKMFHQFDHRFGTFEGATEANLNSGALPQPSLQQKQDRSYFVKPRYWIDGDLASDRLGEWKRDWLIAFRDIASYTLERSATFSVLPRIALGHTGVVVLFGADTSARQAAAFLANGNSLVFDFLTRQKLAGTHLTFAILNQLPMLPPNVYKPTDIERIAELSMELVYTADDVEGFARDAGVSRSPYMWDPERRALVRAELDAYYAHLYGLTRDELRYILDPKDVFGEQFPSETFRVLKEREEKQFGEYRTRRLVLEAFDRLAESDRFRGEMINRVSAFEDSKKLATSVG